MFAFGSTPDPTRIRETTTEPPITATSWVPTQAEVALESPAAATGDDLAVGGVYQFSPADVRFSPAATLVLTYTDQAASGLDEKQIGTFHWNPEEYSGQPMTATTDVAQNTFTSTVFQLGTFALGIDEGQPRVKIRNPDDGSTIHDAVPLLTARAADDETGIDPVSVRMRLNGNIVAADYLTRTGDLVWAPSAPLSNGRYTITVSVADTVGNTESAASTFTVDVQYVYLPLVLRGR